MSLDRKRIWMGFKNNFKFVFLLGLILVMILVENYTHDLVFGAFSTDYTPVIYDMSFHGAIERAIQLTFRSNVLDGFFIIIYLFSYTYLLLFTPFLYMVRDDKARMKQYTLATLICYMILIPFYFFFSVRPPGYYPAAGVHQIIYQSPTLLQFVKEVDPLDNCFPSGHVAVPLIIFFLLLPMKKNREYRRYCIFVGVLSVLITLSVLYLGAHWVVDIIAGALIAVFASFIAKQDKVMNWLDAKLGRLISIFHRVKKEEAN
jgi:membrane-associated phospholipid phosphatase